MTISEIAGFTLADLRALSERLAPALVRTPLHRCHPDSALQDAARSPAEVALKLELFQIGGSFKIRGVLANFELLGAAALRSGVTAVSAGNHAIAVAYGARLRGLSAKVVMPRTANPFRVAQCRRFGADVVFTENVHAAFERARQIEREEGRAFIHPFEGQGAAMGTGTVGLEILDDWRPEVLIVPIGGGGLCAGVATAAKMLDPGIEVFGVEPFGADTMFRSFAAGSPQAIETVATIADSLGAPAAEPYSFGLCRAALREIVRVTDEEIRAAMQLLAEDLKLLAEPAAAAGTAALLGPLRERVAGKRVATIVCGSNIDLATYARLMA